MALQAIKHGIPFPAWPATFSVAPSLSTGTYTIDAAGEKAAYVFAASAAKAIRKVHVRTATVATGDTVDVRIETVDTGANGDPTGTLHTVNSNGALVIAGGDDNVWKSVTLTADTATLAIGDVLSIVIVNGGGGGSMTFAGYADHNHYFPYGELFTSAWAKQLTPPIIVPEYSDGSFAPIYGYLDIGGPVNTNTFKSDDTTNKRGNQFQLAFPARATGAWAFVDGDATFTIKLFDSDGTSVLGTTAATNAFQRQTTTGGLFFLPFTTTATLAASTTYYLAVVPGTTANISTYDFDVPAAGMLDMFPGGQSCHASVYTSSVWTATTTRRAYLGVFLDAFSDGVGSGGGAAMLINSGGLVG
jgi:hypothetical protein